MNSSIYTFLAIISIIFLKAAYADHSSSGNFRLPSHGVF